MILVSATIMALTAEAGNTEVKPFEGVNVNVPACVRFVYGETYGVDIQATDSMTISAIRYNVQDGVLKIRSIDGADKSAENVCITIVSPQEPTLTVGRHMDVKPTKRVKKAPEKN